MRHSLFLSRVLLLSLFLAGCARPVAEKAWFEPLSPDTALTLAATATARGQKLEGWEALKPGLDASLAAVRRRPADALAVDEPHLRLTWGQLRRSLEDLRDLLPRLDARPELLAENFRWFALRPGTLLTGYYEPTLPASPTPGPDYPHPIYGVPPDLLTADLGDFHPRFKGKTLVYRLKPGGIEPYPDRAAIDFGGALRGMGAEIAWTRDLVDLSLLQVQGSGVLVYPDGSSRHVLYAGKNGRAYVSAGRVLADRGLMSLEGMSMQKIKAYLSEHPELVREVMEANPSYVFFRLADSGPYGAMGAVLTPMASLAVDPAVIPLGAPLVLSTELKSLGPDKARRIFGLALAQDTGGAITGTRADLFCGAGAEAEFTAGHLKDRADLYLLVSRRALGGQGAGLPKPVAPE